MYLFLGLRRGKENRGMYLHNAMAHLKERVTLTLEDNPVP